MNANAAAQELSAWTQVARVATLFAIDPAGLKGIVLRAGPGPVREQWLQQLCELLPPDTPWRRLPIHTGDDRLLGGLDLSATLRSGRPVAERGLLAQSDGGVLLIAMSERLESGAAARLAAVLDSREVAIERNGVSQRIPVTMGMIALDEGIGDDEATPEALADRFAIHLSLDQVAVQQIGVPSATSTDVAAARARLSSISVSNDLVEVLCTAAMGFGIESLRVPILAIRVARACAALDGRTSVSDADAAMAAKLVFGSRVKRLPDAEQSPEPENNAAPEREDTPPDADINADDSGGDRGEANEKPAHDDETTTPQSLHDQVLEATRAAIPPALMQQLRYPKPGRSAARSSAKSAARRRPARRGRRVGSRPGDLSDGSRLNLVETLRAAAPWQNLRRANDVLPDGAASPTIKVRREDFRINCYQQRAATTTVFAVDASGSAALHRLAEAKGAVELMLAESYQRRDQVALVSFRGQQAELLLPPTRSLVRAKRSLAALPGGGGTPLAAGIRLALEISLGIRRKAETPVIILLTDGRANVSLDGRAERPLAESEAFEAACSVRVEGITALLVDTSTRPRPAARELADAMGAFYLGLPHANAERLTHAARTVVSGQTNGGGRHD